VLLEVSSDAKHYELAVVDVTGARQVLGERPTRSLSAESIQAYGQTYFTGVYVGMYATGRGKRSQSPADFDFFEYVGQPGPV
jgi:alpha-N-arabinofuranosidase